METFALAIKHLMALGATPVQIQIFMDEVITYHSAIRLANRESDSYLAGFNDATEGLRSREREKKRAYRASVSPDSPGTKESSKEKVIYLTSSVEGECEGETPVPATSPDKPRTKQIEAWFEEWYAEYPKKVGKGAARKSYYRAIMAGISDRMLLAAAKKVRSSKTEYKFIPHPATWLNQERWLDEWEQPASATILAGPWKEFKPEKEINVPTKEERENQLRLKGLLKKSLDKDKEEKGE